MERRAGADHTNFLAEQGRRAAQALSNHLRGNPLNEADKVRLEILGGRSVPEKKWQEAQPPTWDIITHRVAEPNNSPRKKSLAAKIGEFFKL